MAAPLNDTPSERAVARVLTWVEETAIAYILATMVGIQFANVVFRSFALSIDWALAGTLLLFLLLILLGMSRVLRAGQHIAVDVVMDLAPPRIQWAGNVFVGLLFILYCALFTWEGYWIFDKFSGMPFSRLTYHDVKLPRWIGYGIFTAGFAYLTITVVFETIQIARRQRLTLTAGHEAAQDVEEAIAEHGVVGQEGVVGHSDVADQDVPAGEK